ncbi:MAG TPA: hypothetical protein VFJ65_04955, partial [Solirubrobacterales bacterium]|nr:hypothetical protein [Solirubrobacterales bacterium]
REPTEPMKAPHAARKGKLRRGLGVPWLFAAAYSAVGFSIYFALGVVAERPCRVIIVSDPTEKPPAIPGAALAEATP